MTISNIKNKKFEERSKEEQEKFCGWVCRGWGKFFGEEKVTVENLQSGKLLVNAPISFNQLVELWDAKLYLEKQFAIIGSDSNNNGEQEHQEENEPKAHKKVLTFGEVPYKEISKDFGVTDYGAKLIGELGEEKFKKNWLFYEEYGQKPFEEAAHNAVDEYVQILETTLKPLKEKKQQQQDIESLVEDFFIQLNSRKYITDRELENVQLNEWIFTVVLAEKLVDCGVDKAKEIAYQDLMENKVTVLGSLQNIYSKLFAKIVNG